MSANNKIQAMTQSDLETLLRQTNQYEDWIKGNIRCKICDSIITIDNLRLLIPAEELGLKKFYFCCNNMDCYMKLCK